MLTHKLIMASLSLTISLLATLAFSTPIAPVPPNNQPASSSLIPVLQPPTSLLRHRTTPANYIYRIPHTQTHLSLQLTTAFIPDILLPMLADAYSSVFAHLLTDGDGLLAAGAWSFAQANVGGRGRNVGVSVWNANNHQMTWGVLGSAIWGLSAFMRSRGIFGAVVFQVWDGVNQVGEGGLVVS